MNDRKVSGEQLRTGPLGSFESRIKTCPWADEISMHSPLPTLRLALRQTSPLSLKSATVIVFPVSENDLKGVKRILTKLPNRWVGYIILYGDPLAAIDRESGQSQQWCLLD